MKRIAIFVGTRPEVLKTAPIARALAAYRDEVVVDVLALNQSQDLLARHLAEEGLNCKNFWVFPRPSDRFWLTQLTEKLLQGASSMIDGLNPKPNLVLVQGDTTSAMAAAMAAYYDRIPVGHVEAGLRTWRHDPFPEEMNRKVITQLARLHFAPTAAARNYLNDEASGTTFLTGNTSIDQLHYDLGRAEDHGADILAATAGKKRVLVTCHRREGWNSFLPKLFEQTKLLLTDPEIAVIWPAHPNPFIQNALEAFSKQNPNLWLRAPMSHRAFVKILDNTDMVWTDSGGVVEEMAALGVPGFVLRNETERPEALSSSIRLMTTDTMHMLATMTHSYFSEPPRPRAPSTVFGDGTAGIQIAKHCIDFLGGKYGPQKE